MTLAASSTPSAVAPAPGLAVSLRGVRRTFDAAVHAVADVSLDIQSGQFVSLLGPSGCGKSTLLRIIAGLDAPTCGEAVVHRPGETPADPRALRRAVAYVFQDPHLMPWRSVLRNVELPLELRRIDRRIRHEAALAAIEQVGLADFASRYPAQLSGGMRMRVSLARALVTNPKLLLLDEPFGALDEMTRQRLDEQLYALWQRRGMTVLFVTHSIVEAACLAQRVVVFSARPARVVLDHAVDLPVERPASLRTEPRFIAEVRQLQEALAKGEQR